MIAAPASDSAPPRLGAYPTPARALPAALDRATEDHALDGLTIKVLLWCYKHLDFDAYRPAKHGGLALLLRTRRQTVGRAFRILETGGYLEPGAREGAVPTYRLRRIRLVEEVTR